MREVYKLLNMASHAEELCAMFVVFREKLPHELLSMWIIGAIVTRHRENVMLGKVGSTTSATCVHVWRTTNRLLKTPVPQETHREASRCCTVT